MERSPLDELREVADALREATDTRNKLIVELRVDGYEWTRIADATGLSLAGVYKIARMKNGGSLPIPRQRA
jgi:DNA-directed RNA polymerase specialized sigma24 family protein